MLGMHQKEKREEVEFFIKNIILVTTFVAGGIFGVSYLEKFDKQQTLRAKLIGDTNINSLENGIHTAPESDSLFCYIRGSYIVKNIGSYTFSIQDVEFELHEIPLIHLENPNPGIPISYTLSERLAGETDFDTRQVGETVKIDVLEQFGPNNELQRSFGFIVPMDEGPGSGFKRSSNYVVIARATAGIDTNADGIIDDEDGFVLGDSLVRFLDNDLTHMTGARNIC